MQTCRFSNAVVCKPFVGATKHIFVGRKSSRLIAVRSSEEDIISGEWPVTIGLNSWDNCDLYYLDKMLKEGLVDLKMSSIMSTEVVSVSLSDTRESAKNKLADTPAYVEGAPVLDDAGKVVGVILKTDLEDGNAQDAVSSFAQTENFATSPPDEEIAEAACTMLKSKDYVIPVVDENDKLLGLVTRTDVFRTMEYQRNKATQKQ